MGFGLSCGVVSKRPGPRRLGALDFRERECIRYRLGRLLCFFCEPCCLSGNIDVQYSRSALVSMLVSGLLGSRKVLDFDDGRHTPLLVSLSAGVLGKRCCKVGAEPRPFTALDQPVRPVPEIDARGEMAVCFPWSHANLPRKRRWSRPV